jgi:tRNA(Ile)-lysidine synthetase-like protein
MTQVSSAPVIAAISGGVDSMVMLDMLIKQGRSLVIAHVNHGIRKESDEEEKFVSAVAQTLDFPFVSIKLHLHEGASEELARTKRSAWLQTLQRKYDATGIATAHHQDDVLETMFINLYRGTGWRGLCSLRSTATIERPLLAMSKSEIVGYAIGHTLEWHEDETNQSFRYLRNRIRHWVIPRLSSEQREILLNLNQSQLELRKSVDAEIIALRTLYRVGPTIKRYPLIMCEEYVGYEMLRDWLGEPLEMMRMKDLLLFAKAARSGTKWSLDGRRFVVAQKDALIVLPPRD